MYENIKKRLADNAVAINDALSEIYSFDSATHGLLTEYQRYGLLDGGKRIRAFLVMEICRLFGGEERTAQNYACAIEMIHASSLIHDDMPCMDNDDMRRGKPALHKAFGETAALLAGDAMEIKAFSVISNNPYSSAEINLNAIKALALASGDAGMLAGQAVDTLTPEDIKTVDDLINLHNLKTGRLIRASAILGCLSANIDSSCKEYDSLISYSEKLGLAFQIIDDVLDSKEGKLENNSFVNFMSVDQAMNEAYRLTDEAISSVRSFDNGILEELAHYLTAREY